MLAKGNHLLPLVGDEGGVREQSRHVAPAVGTGRVHCIQGWSGIPEWVGLEFKKLAELVIALAFYLGDNTARRIDLRRGRPEHMRRV